MYSWEQRKLLSLGKIETGNTPSTSVSEYYNDDGLLWYSIAFKYMQKDKRIILIISWLLVVVF